MELCDGSLQDYIDQNQGKKIPEKDILIIFKSICKAIEYLHEKGIVHRDLKPGNVLFKKTFNKGKVWKITDFGTSV
jgi:eukaryotic-like serine/threonine-protein kinase